MSADDIKIMKFMGGKPKKDCLQVIADRMNDDQWWLPFHGIVYTVDYSKSYDWIMPVLEKIENIPGENFNVRLQLKNNRCDIFNGTNPICGASMFPTKVETLHATVIQFLIWYSSYVNASHSR